MIDPQYAGVLLNIYSLAIGFTVAGICASLVPIYTGSPLIFEMETSHNNMELLLGAVCRIIAGPFLILQNTIKAILSTGREPYWVMMAIVIAGFWSFCQGVLILEAICKLGACSG